jgi:restriction endonuclease S subunit
VISNKQLKLRTDPSIADSKFVYYYIASEAGVEYIKSRGLARQYQA